LNPVHLPQRSRPLAALLGARIFSWVLACAVLARTWRAVGLWQEADANDGFVWLPIGIAADVLVALLITALVLLVAHRFPRVGLGWGMVLGLAHIAWLGVNLVSFTLTQAPVTFQRVRGDEGVALDAHALLRWEDVIPVIAFAVVALAALPLAWQVGARALDLVTRRALAVLAGIALAIYACDALVLRDNNFGVADHPVLTLASSFVLSAFDEQRRPALKKKPRRDHIESLLVARTPAQETAPPLRQRDAMKNVIVFFSEGIAREHTSLGGSEATPNVRRRLADGGLELTRYYSTYHKSIAAIFSLVCADFPPPNGRNIVEINPRIDCGEMSTVLHNNGLRTGLFHGGDFGFYDKLMLLGMRHWDIMEDARAMSDPLVYEETEWGIDDRATVDHLLAWIDTLPPDERFGALLIPITAHWPYWIPSDVDPLLPPISSKNRFLNAVHFLDGAFERLMVGLEERDLVDDTAVIYLADHGETVGERPRATAGRRLAYQPSLHVPLAILAPGMWPGGSVSDRLASHADLLPTMLDLLGMPADERHRGTSIIAPDREPARVFIGASNGPRYVGWIDGDQKFVVNQTTGVREAYDVAKDPDERHNIVEELVPVDVERLEQDALAFAELQLASLTSAKKVDSELDIEGLFVDVVDVRVRREPGVVECTRVAGDVQGRRVCPGEDHGVFQGRMKRRAGGATHDCVVMHAPREGVLELEVKGQAWLPLVTRARMAATGVLRAEGAESVRFAVWSDGVKENARSIRSDGNLRISFAAPRSSLLMRVGGNGTGQRDLCVTLSDRGWRNRPVRPGSTAVPR
jgi:phosphoglycerol transferase MdoB-like AlkP superfamily enzyme